MKVVARVPLWMLVALVALVVIVVAGCGGGADDPASSDSATTTSKKAAPGTGDSEAEGGEGTTSSPATPSGPVDEATVFRVRIEGGQPVGGPTVWRVKQGDDVRISVRSDTADELHLHGYDVSQDVDAGTRADLAFTATEPGSFELELEQSAVLVGNLEVR